MKRCNAIELVCSLLLFCALVGCNSESPEPAAPQAKTVAAAKSDPASKTSDPASKTSDPASKTSDPASKTSDPASKTTEKAATTAAVKTVKPAASTAVPPPPQPAPAVPTEALEVAAPIVNEEGTRRLTIVHSVNLQGEVEPCG